jgi:hypothetical protein
MFFETGFEWAAGLSDIHFIAIWACKLVYAIVLEFVLGVVGVLE